MEKRQANSLTLLNLISGQTLRDLCEVSKYSHVTIHDYIRKLMAADIITKASFDGDGRRVSYMLTDKATKVLDDLYRQIDGLR